MRKLIAIALLAFSINVQAQTTSTPAIDTLADAATVNLVSPANYFPGDGIFSVGVVATKIDGTTAGYAILQASIDGTNYKPLTGTSADSFALANTAGAQVKNWFLNGVKPNKIRISIVGSGTQNTQVKGYFIKK